MNLLTVDCGSAYLLPFDRFRVRTFLDIFTALSFLVRFAALINGSEGETFNWRAGTFTEIICTLIGWPRRMLCPERWPRTHWVFKSYFQTSGPKSSIRIRPSMPNLRDCTNTPKPARPVTTQSSSSPTRLLNICNIRTVRSSLSASSARCSVKVMCLPISARSRFCPAESDEAF